jgi:hypothetical protein
MPTDRREHLENITGLTRFTIIIIFNFFKMSTGWLKILIFGQKKADPVMPLIRLISSLWKEAPEAPYRTYPLYNIIIINCFRMSTIERC